jgi:hypothetical protein
MVGGLVHISASCVIFGIRQLNIFNLLIVLAIAYEKES